MIETTIAAISTAFGEAGIGIVRMSGPCSLDILKKIFVNSKGKASSFNPRHMYYGIIKDNENDTVIDECLAVYMKAPHTYTGEDVVEIQCHGGNISVKNILALLLKNGAIPAQRGEFTKRAFLSGRIDLSQAEAVIDLIKANTSKSFDVAISQMRGNLFYAVRDIRKEILELLINLTVNMDYPDEDIEILTYSKMLSSLSFIYDKLKSLDDTAEEGKIIREGLKVAIVGKPNVGKSSLMNLLLKENRSIVTDIPGTTRDTIEENCNIRGIAISFIDTAGIHESSDIVESIGIERSKDAFNKADLVLVVLDSSKSLEKEDEELLFMAQSKNHIIVLNKLDLGAKFEIENSIHASFINNEGIENIIDAIEAFVDKGKLSTADSLIVTNVRHQSLIKKAVEEINEAINMTKENESMDFIEINVRAAFDYLGEIIGETASDEVINEVFSRFCLGK